MTSSSKSIKKPKSKLRKLTTPEGVPLHLELADVGDRASAFIMDMTIIILSGLVGIFAILWLTSLVGAIRLGFIIVLLFMFFLRNFYFMFFELKWSGRTPGKKKMGLRVVDRYGRQLTSDAIFARNMMREIEIFIPLMVIFSSANAPAEQISWLSALIWAAILLFLPMMNKDNLRAGDLVGGTLVVKEPKVELKRDMISGRADSINKGRQFAFTKAQVDAYGIHELQMLEQLLRLITDQGRQKRKAAYNAISNKIKYSEKLEPAEIDLFLEAYYQALRQRLEGSMLMGKRKTNKFDV